MSEFRAYAGHCKLYHFYIDCLSNRIPMLPRASMDSNKTKSPYTPTLAIPLVMAAMKLLLHLVTNLLGGYGYFRDELYYLACAENLDLGYVDQPPLSLYILAVWRLLVGDSLFALRLLPAMVGAATVFVAGLMTRALGGGRMAQLLACLATLVSPIFLAMNSFYSMNAFDILLWAVAAYTVIRLLQTGNEQYWLALGIVLGLGLLNKIGISWFALGIGAGMLLTNQRGWFRTRWPYLAGSLALLLFIPYIIWNFTHEFAHVEFVTNAMANKYADLSPITFTVGQFLVSNPVTAVLWLAGLYFLLFSSEGKVYRPLGIAYLVAFGILVVIQHSKPEYLSPAYTILFAAGGVLVEKLSARPWFKLLPRVYFGILICGLVLAPATLPILPVETYIRYADAIGIKPHTSEGKDLAELPQFYADMFGWEEKAEAVARVFQNLPPDEQSRCAIFADNYGRSAAIDFFRKKLGLPRAIGRHNNYWIWGPRSSSGEIVIILGGDLEDKKELFESVAVVGEISCQYCMPYENHLKIYLCRKLRVPLADLWPRLKQYD